MNLARCLLGLVLAVGIRLLLRRGWPATLLAELARRFSRGGPPTERSYALIVAALIGLTCLVAGIGAVRSDAHFGGDAPNYVMVVQSLVLERDLDLHGQWADLTSSPHMKGGNLSSAHSVMSLGARGEWYPKHPWLYPALMVPVYLAAGPAGMLIVNLFAALLLTLVAFRLAARFVPPEAAAAAALVLFCAGSIPKQMLPLGVDVGGALAILLSAYLLATLPPPSEGPLARRAALAGLAAGFATLITYRNGLFLPFLLGYAASQAGWRAALAFALGAFPSVAVMLGMNAWMFGSPLVSSYDRAIIIAGGVPQVESHRLHLGVEHLGRGGLLLLTDLLTNAPVALVTLAGWPAFRRAAPGAAGWLGAAVAAAVLFTLFFRFADPNRLLLPALALSVLPLAYLFPSGAPRTRTISSICSAASRRSATQ